MRIAVTYENGQIFQHFGHTAQFKIYDVQDGKILSAQALAEGKLTFDPNAHCDHHDHAHGQGHTCGQHGCGGHCGEH